MGAAYLAGLAVGYWKDKEEVVKNWEIDKTFTPDIPDEKREEMISGWDRAVKMLLRLGQITQNLNRHMTTKKWQYMRVQIPISAIFISYLNPKPFLFLNQLMQAYLPCCALLQLSY